MTAADASSRALADAPLAIDLFCGLGGWTDGLLALGYRVIGYDIEEHVYGDQRYQGELVVQDVLTLHGSQFKDAALIVASPPCQEYSYMAMPWSLAKAKAAAIRADTTGAELERLNRLFNACFRIQKEASIAAGRHIPMVVENVRGAIPWVGRSRWNFGSFHLWGDVPALMPIQKYHRRLKAKEGEQWNINRANFTGALGWDEGRKNDGGSWFGIGSPGQKVVGQNPVHRRDGAPHTKHLTNPGEHFKPPARVSAEPPAEGRKGAGAGAEWFDQNISSLPSSSPRRKAASAMIAKIPEPLSRHIGAVYWPGEAA